MARRNKGEIEVVETEGVPPARGAQAAYDRRARIDELRKAKKRKDRLRSVAFMSLVLIGTGAFFAKPAYNWIDGKLNDPLKRSIASFGVPLAEAGCDPITQDPTTGIQDHIRVGQRGDYKFIPPSSGKHYENPVSFQARPFFTDKDAQPVENLVHNMEHGYTILWYDATLPKSELSEIEDMSLRLRDDAAFQLFIATPWDTAYGEFPDGMRVALTHWSGPQNEDGEPDPDGDSFGHRLFCERTSGQAVEDFMTKYPATDAPERNIR
ncbi:MAG: DUF3105 domain-containing protein [Sporichthyaceae bacterium]